MGFLYKLQGATVLYITLAAVENYKCRSIDLLNSC